MNAQTRLPKVWTNQQIVASIMAILAGYIGAAVFTHTAGIFVTFMTGNAEKAMLGFFQNQKEISIGALTISFSFFVGVFTAALCKRHLWKNHPQGAAVLTTISLAIAACLAFKFDNNAAGFHQFWFYDLVFVAFGTGALNSVFTKDGETVIPLTYHSGTLVKFAQGVEKHFSGGTYRDWAKHGIMYGSFSLGALIGGFVSLSLSGEGMLLSAAIASACVALVTYWIKVETQS